MRYRSRPRGQPKIAGAFNNAFEKLPKSVVFHAAMKLPIDGFSFHGMMEVKMRKGSERSGTAGRVVLALLSFVLLCHLESGADDEKVAKRIEQLTTQLIKNLEDLAKRYDTLGDPEAAHFLASCAVGFGSKDAKVAGIKSSREVDVFLARLRGGELLADVNPIDTALRGIAFDSKKLLDSLLPQLKRGELSAAAKTLVHDLIPKYEIARGAEEYIQATQRFNKLRRAMGLRAVLWDFEHSNKLILACWYMGETDDYRSEEKSDTDSPMYTEAVELAKQKCARPLYRKLQEYPDTLRSYALIRQELLNPNSRQLWLAHWAGGKKVNPMTAYAIPQLPYRQDIPTPSERYSRETVVEQWPGWKDTEDTILLSGAKIPLARYPHDAEADAPCVFSNGKGAMENGWAKSELDFLGKAGVPVMLRAFTAGQVSDVNVDIRTKAGKTVPTRVYFNGDKRVTFYGDWITVLALPEIRLDPGTEYTVKITFQANQTPIERSWSFKTTDK